MVTQEHSTELQKERSHNLLNKIFRKYIRHWYIVLALQLLMSPFTFLDAYAMKYFCDKILLTGNSSRITPFIMFFIAISSIFFLVELSLSLYCIKLTLLYDFLAKQCFFVRIIFKPILFFHKYSSGEALYRLLNDTAIVPHYLTTMKWGLILNIWTVFCVITVMSYFSIKLTLILLLVIPVQFTLTLYLGKYVRLKQHAIKDSDQSLLGFAENIFSNAVWIKSFSLENRACDDWLQSYAKRNMTERRLNVIQQIGGSLVLRIIGFSAVLVFGVGTHQVLIGVLNLGTLFALMQLAARLGAPVQYLCNFYLSKQDMQVSLQRLEHTWNIFEKGVLLPEIGRTNLIDSSILFKQIAVEEVTFRYSNASTLLQDLSFNVNRGEVVKLVGANGCGKSTLLKIMAGFLQPSTGKIKIDNISLCDIPEKITRRNIVYLGENSFWFRSTIKENMLYGTTACSDAEYDAACRVCGVDKIFERIPLGSHTIVNPGGNNLSNGERQRLALAKILLYRPSVLLLDEAFSSIPERDLSNLIDGIFDFMNRNVAIVYVQHGGLRRNDRIVSL